jgi:hypothetical protein
VQRSSCRPLVVSTCMDRESDVRVGGSRPPARAPSKFGCGSLHKAAARAMG